MKFATEKVFLQVPQHLETNLCTVVFNGFLLNSIYRGKIFKQLFIIILM